MKKTAGPSQIFHNGNAFAAADGQIYRVERLVTVNGVELVIYQIIDEIKDRRYKVAGQGSAAVPTAEFARMLTARSAVFIADLPADDEKN
jgi:hypothetical protein